MVYNYVYRLDHIETGEFYIGSRSSKYHPSMDKYMGSMKTWKPNKLKLIKTIIKDDFENRTDAVEYEVKLIIENISNVLNRNYHIPSKGFHTDGTLTVKDKNNNFYKVLLNDERYLSGELVHCHKGMINVKDKYGNRSKIFINDERFLSGELIHLVKGMINVKDENNNLYFISKNDERFLSGEFIPIWKNKNHTEETIEKMKLSHKLNGDQKGNKNSQYGTCWITKDKETKKINKNELNIWLEHGWLKGRK